VSFISGQVVYEVRKMCGQQLAIEASVAADLVSTVPDSATPAALGYSLQVRPAILTLISFTVMALHYLIISW